MVQRPLSLGVATRRVLADEVTDDLRDAIGRVAQFLAKKRQIYGTEHLLTSKLKGKSKSTEI